MFQTTNQIKLSIKSPHMCATVTFSGILIRSDFAAPQQWASVDPPPNPSMWLSLATPGATVKTSADNDF